MNQVIEKTYSPAGGSAMVDIHRKHRGGSTDKTISFGRGRKDRPIPRDMIDERALSLHLSARLVWRLSPGRDEIGISGDFGKV
jgi:hypothetical protein